MTVRSLRSFIRRLPPLLFALALVLACAPDHATPVEPLEGDDDALLADAEPHVANDIRILKLTTPDGSGQTVHPDFAQMSGWASPFLLVVTPYTYGSTAIENPTMFARQPDFEWKPLDPMANPIAKPSVGFLSDPDMVAIPGTGELWVYYRHFDSRNTIYLARTRDGVSFDTPVEVAAGNHQTIVSPAVVRLDSLRWRMWSVNAGVDGCHGASTTVELRRSTNGLKWLPPVQVSLTQPGFSVWHLDVQWIPSRREYWALYNVKVAGSCATTALFLATSRDGLTWKTFPSPVLSAGAIPEFSNIVYRSTFAYDRGSDKVRLWYSGAHYDGSRYVWRSAFDRRDRAELFESIARPAQAGVARRAALPQPAFFNPP